MSAGRRVAVVIVGVGDVPAALLHAAQQFLGPLQDVVALGLAPDAEAADVEATLRRTVAEADQGGGLLMLADLCGSTLANVCYSVAAGEKGCDVLCGTNLAMLMKIFSADRTALDATALARALADTGRRGIRLYSDAASDEARETDER